MRAHFLYRLLSLCGVVVFFLAACASNTEKVEVPEGPLKFIDLALFDRQLQQKLRDKPDEVRIEFVDRVKPSQLPERLNVWMLGVQNAGGQVRVSLPPGDMQPRGLPLLSFFPALWSAIRSERPSDVPKEVIEGYEAQIQLRNDGSGDRVVDSIVLKRR